VPDEPLPTGDEPTGPSAGESYEHAREVVRAIEAIVMVADQPVEPGLLAQLLEVPAARVEELADALAASYAQAGHGFALVRVAGGYRFQSHPDMAAYVERFVLEGQSARLSAAALETLAIIAYKQPISRAQVASIRGVDPDGVMRTLAQRGYIEPVAKDPGPGQAILFGTTRTFLERLGLDSLSQLPPIAEFVPGADVLEALDQTLRPGGRVPQGPTAPAGSGPTPAEAEPATEAGPRSDAPDLGEEAVGDVDGG
jgi:segregation and condensation protein B